MKVAVDSYGCNSARAQSATNGRFGMPRAVTEAVMRSVTGVT
jgi:hypothetical protein